MALCVYNDGLLIHIAPFKAKSHLGEVGNSVLICFTARPLPKPKSFGKEGRNVIVVAYNSLGHSMRRMKSGTGKKFPSHYKYFQGVFLW